MTSPTFGGGVRVKGVADMQRNWRALAVAGATASALLAGTGAISQAVVPSTVPAVVPAEVPASEAVRVATFNVLKATNAKGVRSWKKRRVALKRTLRVKKPDVLMVQEASTKKWKGKRHIDDLNRVMGKVGYRITSTDYDSCTAGCTRGAHIFYNPSRMRLTTPPGSVRAGGMAGISTVGRLGFGSVQDRNASWAFLTPVGSKRTSLYISVHLPNNKTAFAEGLRLAVARNLRPWADGLIRASGLSGAQIVIGGDLNSYANRQPYGAQHVLSSAGLIDAYTAPVIANPHYGTINYTPKTKKYKGFPPRPHYYKTNPTRIDYVFSTVRAQRHEAVVFLKKSGKFKKIYRVSDHNMVLAHLPLR